MNSDQKLASAFSDAGESTGLVLWRVTNAWQAAQRKTLKPFGLTHVQFVLLASLVWLDGDSLPTQQKLADHAGTDPMMTSQVLRALERMGLIERRPDAGDRRAKLLRPTRDGIELANRAIVAVEACDARFFGSLGDDRSDLTRMLRRLV